MANLLMDGCDHYNTTVLQSATTHWNFIGGSPTVLPTSGRFGGPCLNMNNSGNGLQAIMDNNMTDFIQGGWLKIPTISISQVNAFLTSVPLGPASKIRMDVSGTGAVIAYNGNQNGTTQTLGISSNNVFPLNVWNWGVWKVHISSTVGTVEVWINGIRVLNLSGVDTLSDNVFSPAYVSRIGFGQNCNQLLVDDPFIWDTTGTTCNSIPAPQKSVTTFPNGVGAFAQFALTGAASNQAAVNEASPDDDTSYNSSNTVSNRDSFTHGSVSGITTVTGAMLTVRSRVDDATAHTLNMTVRKSGSDTIGAAKTLSGSYLNYLQDASINPNTSAAWASGLTEINAAEIGYELAS